MILHMAKSSCTVVFLVLLLQSCQLISSQSHTWQEAFNALGIKWNRDGTLNRSIQIKMVEAEPYVKPSASPPQIALSQDIPLGPRTKAYVRAYIPADEASLKKKLPLIIYFHGGDLILYSASTFIFHKFCNELASQLPAVIVSVEYRLAPENRLPAAFDDALNAIFWVKNQSLGIGGRDPWMEYADFKRVFLLGSSAGANIAYHAALRAVDFNLKPLKIQGIILNQAYFGGVKRTKSEIRLRDDPYVPLYVNDVIWTLVLPKRLDRDHEFCNPISGGTYLGRIFKLPKVLIKADYGDPLVGRSVELKNYLLSEGLPVSYHIRKGGYHGMELLDEEAAQELYDDIHYFINDSCLSPKSEDLSQPRHHASY